MNSRFFYIIVSIVAVILVSPYIRDMGKTGYLITIFLTATIPLVSYYALHADRKRAKWLLLIAAPYVALECTNLFFSNHYLMVAGYVCGSILYFYIVVLLLKNLLSHKTITADLIYCAISIYLLIGVTWAGIYTVIEGVSPGSFSGISETSDFLYFSFVTLTTVGFGDAAPLSAFAKRMAIFEAALGSIYMAIIIAMIVGRYMQAELDSESETRLKK